MRPRAVGLLATCALAFLAPPLAAEAQPAGVPRIGILLPGFPPSPSQPEPLVEAFRQGLRDHGYVEGRNIVTEWRFAEGRTERLPDLAAELVRLKVAVIVTATGRAIEATKNATTTIPIVMAAAGDPVGSGLVASLARPGGNLTGLSLFDTELGPKRLELLKEVVPRLSHVGALWSPNDLGMTVAFSSVQRAAQALGLQLLNMAVQDPSDFQGTFRAASGEQVGALIVLAQPFTVRHRAQIVDLAVKNRLPAMYTLRSFVAAGGLMSYGASLPDLYRRAAYYVDRILKGAKPADLPVEQPTRFELVINLGTAKALGLTIPQSLLLRADEVIH
ncbi:MAG: ABC transporter substrate-binding protein [Candidatus Rokubacteria bacterium]|nr:ABC transporter substrate-binding protein [Candidatus Rokubacteria bacterium]